MELIFEILFTVLLEGTLELSTTKSIKVPLFVRIICIMFLAAIYGGLTFLLFAIGITEGEPVVLFVSVALFCLFTGVFIYKFIQFKNKR